MFKSIASLMNFQLAPAYAFAGATSPSAFNVKGPVDSFIPSGPKAFQNRTPASMPSMFFCSNNDETVAIVPDADALAAAKSDENTPCATISAHAVYSVLIFIPMRHGVLLQSVGLTQKLVGKGWIEILEPRECNLMKDMVKSGKLEAAEAELAQINRTLSCRDALLHRLGAFLSGFFKRPCSAEPKLELSRTQGALPVSFTGWFRTLKSRRRELENTIAEVKIAEEWLKYTAKSPLGFIRLTDEGKEVMTALDAHRGDPRMEITPIDDYLELIASESKLKKK